jgi:ribonuclease R
MVHISTMADDYYRFMERVHVLKGEHNDRVYRLGDRVSVQVVRVDLERRQIDLALTEILEAVRKAEQHPRGTRRRPQPRPAAKGAGRPKAPATAPKERHAGRRPGRRGRASRKAGRRR